MDNVKIKKTETKEGGAGNNHEGERNWEGRTQNRQRRNFREYK